MRCSVISILGIAVVNSVSAQQAQQPGAPERVSTVPSALSDSSNLPVEKVGNNDLLGITVYDSP